MKREGKTARANLDFYPTPRPVAQVLANWFENSNDATGLNWLDPAAGDGALIKGMRDNEIFTEQDWSAIEINELHRSELELVSENVVTGDALKVEWPDASVVANPPFFLLEQFWEKAVEHRVMFEAWCAVLTPVAWWQAERRAHFVQPDVMLALNWRPTFRKRNGAGHKGSQDFVWAILAPRRWPWTRYYRVRKPEDK